MRRTMVLVAAVALVVSAVSTDDVAAALHAHPGTRLVSVVSPGYDGACSDTAGVVAAARAGG